MQPNVKIEMDDEAMALFGQVWMHYDKLAGGKVDKLWLFKKICQNEIDTWGE